MPGLVVPAGTGDVRPFSRADQTATWKLDQKDCSRLIEYARSE